MTTQTQPALSRNMRARVNRWALRATEGGGAYLLAARARLYRAAVLAFQGYAGGDSLYGSGFQAGETHADLLTTPPAELADRRIRAFGDFLIDLGAELRDADWTPDGPAPAVDLKPDAQNERVDLSRFAGSTLRALAKVARARGALVSQDDLGPLAALGLVDAQSAELTEAGRAVLVNRVWACDLDARGVAGDGAPAWSCDRPAAWAAFGLSPADGSVGPIRQGDRVRSSGGSLGTFVGVTRGGSVWVSWDNLDAVHGILDAAGSAREAQDMIARFNTINGADPATVDHDLAHLGASDRIWSCPTSWTRRDRAGAGFPGRWYTGRGMGPVKVHAPASAVVVVVEWHEDGVRRRAYPATVAGFQNALDWGAHAESRRAAR